MIDITESLDKFWGNSGRACAKRFEAGVGIAIVNWSRASIMSRFTAVVTTAGGLRRPTGEGAFQSKRNASQRNRCIDKKGVRTSRERVMIYVSAPSPFTSSKNSFLVLGSWDERERLAEPLQIEIDLSDYSPVRWNVGGHVMIVDSDIIIDGDILSRAFDFRTVDIINRGSRSVSRFRWATPKLLFLPRM